MLPNAATQFFEEYLSAQPAGDFQILSEARDGQPLVLDELTGKAVNSSLTFFLFHRARRIFFLMSQKENGGCIPRGKVVQSRAAWRHFLRRFVTSLCEVRNM